MDFLTDSERQDIEQDNRRKRAVAVGRLSELALAVQSTEQILDALRETDVETARKIGKAAREVVTLLERLSIAEVASEQQLPLADPEEMPRTEEVKPELQDETQVVEQSVEVEVSVAELEPETQTQDDTDSEVQDSIPDSAQQWLQKILGDNWREKLGVEDGNSLEEIAAKVLEGIRTRKNKGKPDNLYINRVVALLQGQKPKEIAVAETDVTPAAIYQFESTLKKKLGTRNTVTSSSPEAVETLSSTPSRLRPGFQPRTEVVVPIRKEKESEPEQLPKYAQFAELFQQQLDLSSTEKVSLESFFDPKSRGEMTKAKEAALEKVIEHLQPRIDNPEFKLTPEELRWVRSCFGLFSRNGVAENKAPRPLSDLRRRLGDAAQAPRLEEAFFSGLQKLIVNGPQLDMRELYASDFMRAAITPESIDDERFGELRQELTLLLEKKFDESVAYEIGQAIEHNITPSRNADSSASLREAFARIRQLMGVGDLKTTGNAEIDKALRRFVAVKRVGTIAAEMNEDEEQLYQRRVVELGNARRHLQRHQAP